MTRATTLVGVLAVMLFAGSGFALAGGGHHGGHFGHHGGHFGHYGGHHSGIHFGTGHGLHHYGHHHYSHHHHYPYYGYSNYSYPRYYSYRTYSYRRPTSCRPSVIYVQPAQKSIAPQQARNSQDAIPKVEPAPSVVPQTPDATPEPDSTRQSDSATRFVTVRGKPATDDATKPVSAASPVSQLGPQLAIPSVRPVATDDEAPWVVTERSLPERGLTGRIAVAEDPRPSPKPAAPAR